MTEATPITEGYMFTRHEFPDGVDVGVYPRDDSPVDPVIALNGVVYTPTRDELLSLVVVLSSYVKLWPNPLGQDPYANYKEKPND